MASTEEKFAAAVNALQVRADEMRKGAAKIAEQLGRQYAENPEQDHSSLTQGYHIANEVAQETQMCLRIMIAFKVGELVPSEN